MPTFASVGVVGLGLIGGSLARAAKERLGARVFGFDADEGARAPPPRAPIFSPPSAARSRPSPIAA